MKINSFSEVALAYREHLGWRPFPNRIHTRSKRRFCYCNLKLGSLVDAPTHPPSRPSGHSDGVPGLRRSRWLTLTGHHKPTSSQRAKPPTLLVENPAYWCLSNGCCPTDLQQIRDLMSTDFSRYKGPGVVVFSAKGLTAQVEAVRTNPGTRDA